METTQNHIYHYWNGEGWIAFSLPEKYAQQWNSLCQRLMLMGGPGDNRPDWNDWKKFMNEIYDKQ